jgi:hypothetical protein
MVKALSQSGIGMFKGYTIGARGAYPLGEAYVLAALGEWNWAG